MLWYHVLLCWFIKSLFPFQHPDDVIEVRSLRLADNGSFIDVDDDVADVLEDKEVVRRYRQGDPLIRTVHNQDTSFCPKCMYPMKSGHP